MDRRGILQAFVCLAIVLSLLMVGAFIRASVVQPAESQKGEIRFGVEGAPPEFQGNTHGIIATESPENIDAFCRSISENTPENRVILACAYPAMNSIFLPNPCLYQERDPYARLLCHELAHLQGWRHSDDD